MGGFSWKEDRKRVLDYRNSTCKIQKARGNLGIRKKIQCVWNIEQKWEMANGGVGVKGRGLHYVGLYRSGEGVGSLSYILYLLIYTFNMLKSKVASDMTM